LPIPELESLSLNDILFQMEYCFHGDYPFPNTRESWDWYLRVPAFNPLKVEND